MTTVTRWGVHEIDLGEAARDVPITQAAFSASVTAPDGRSVRVPGFRAGAAHRLRVRPDAEGRWSWTTSSLVPELAGREGSFECLPAAEGEHGPVGVAGTFHFAHADGTPHRPVGTTVYNLLQQGDERRAETIEAVAEAGFTKLRFLVLPQGGDHVDASAVVWPFARAGAGWDVTRPNEELFARLDETVRSLGEHGVQADVVLFHPYDRGRLGFDALSAQEDEVYLRYVVARLAAFPNVWWSLANEYDQHERADERWDGVFRALVDADPYGSLRSIHNWLRMYDHNRPWVTHASIQNGMAVEDPARAVLYRDAYRKPIVYDEIKYEGDIPERWGNLDGVELVRRFWNATVAGTYASHGESIALPNGSLSIVEGGPFRGESPARLAFLRRILDEIPAPGLDPIDKWNDETCTAGVAGSVYLRYFGAETPTEWVFRLPVGEGGTRLETGQRYRVEAIDTWGMTIDAVPGEFELTDVERNDAWARSSAPVPLPGRPWIALRITRA